MKIMFSFLKLKQQDANENYEPPTNYALFIETQKRQPNKTYKETFDDTSNKIVRISFHLYAFRILPFRM